MFFVFFLFPMFSKAQVVIEGTIKDMNNNYVDKAIVSILNREREILYYKITNDKGYFRFDVNAHEDSLIINVKLLGHYPQIICIKNRQQKINIYLEPRDVQIKEVIVKSSPISLREDTLTYSVGVFKSSNDRTIGDILKKLPGVEVSKNGAIRYNGEPINKFYIEGLDLLDSKYGVATNNIPVDAVRNVEVIENHQPITLLKNLVETGQAAINLRLSNESKSRPVGTIKAGFGESNDFLWNFDSFALSIKKKSQTVVMYKTNNAGINIASELTEQSINDNSDKLDMPTPLTLFNVKAFSDPFIEENRYLFNKTHVLSLNSLLKTSDNSQLRINANYMNDVLDEKIHQDITYFMPNDNLIINEVGTLIRKSKYLDGMLTYTNNSKEYYLNNLLKYKAKWDNTDSKVQSSFSFLQKYNIPEYNLQNDFKLVKKWGEKIWNISSFVRYLSSPQRLELKTDTINIYNLQNIERRGFYTSNEAYISFTQGLSSLQINVNMEASLESLISNLYKSSLSDSICNDLQTNYLKIVLNPVYIYSLNKLRFTASVSLNKYWMNVEDILRYSRNEYSCLYADPQFSLRYKFNPFWESTLSYRCSHEIGDITDFFQSYILSDYRSLKTMSGYLSKNKKQTYKFRVNYRNPLKTIFFNTALYYTSSKRNLENQQYFIEKQLIISNIKQNNYYKMWMWDGYVGKYISNIMTNVSLTTNCMSLRSEKVQQGQIFPLELRTWNLSPKINTKIGEASAIAYQVDLNTNRLKIKIHSGASESSFYQIYQKLKYYYCINKQLQVNAQLEHLYNEITSTVSSKVFFANLGISYKTKQIEYTFDWNNIFNKKEYTYVLYNTLDTYKYRYRLRPANVLINICFKY